MDLRRTARCATAAGLLGLTANTFLIAYYALEVGREQLLPVSLGSLNDLVGAVGTAMMVPVALAFGPRWVRWLGLAAMGVLTVGGVLLLSGVLTLSVQAPIALAGLLVLASWMLLTSRHLHGHAPASVTRLGVLCGSGVLAGAAVAGSGLLLPAMSWPQLVLLGAGALPGVLAVLAMPVWFLNLGRALRSTATEDAPPQRPASIPASTATPNSGRRPSVPDTPAGETT